MFCKIANALDMENFWLNVDEVFAEVTEQDKEKIYQSISQLVTIMCDSYRENRPDFEGGSIFIFFGKYEDVQRARVLEYYHVKEDDYELSDILTEENAGWIWVADIYCFTNYNLVLVHRKQV